MTIQVIGAGVGRTGTYSLKLALEQLGLGPCHHMEDVLKDPARHVPLWTAAVAGTPDWAATLDGYRSTVDWPTAGFWRELAAAYPDAKVVLTTRSAESWSRSFGETIGALLAARDDMPAPMQPWFEMATAVVRKTGFEWTADHAARMAAFETHVDTVRRTVPADRLLVFEVKDGWAPLCAFLGKNTPTTPFPRTNSRDDFWDRVHANAG